MSTESEKTDDAFQKELVELFGQEAHEWILEIHSALTELQSQPDLDRHTQLLDAVVRGITSLGGSAATVNLSDVERATFALLPFIEILKDRTTATKQDYATVLEQFQTVMTLVTTATGIATNLAPPKMPAHAEPAADLLTLLNALRSLQDDCAVSGLFPCSLIPHVMQRLEHEARQGSEQIQASSFHQMLQDLHVPDAQCLESLRQRLPDVAESLGRLRCEDLTAPEPLDTLAECIRNVDHLQGMATQAHVTPLVTFLTGLRGFLSLIVQRRIVVTSQRVHLVETRIRAVLGTIEDWIIAGERERNAMGRLLPVA